MRAHETAKKITALERSHFGNEVWNVVSEIAIQICFRHGGFIFGQKEIEAPVIRPIDLSAELYDEWTSIDEETRITKVTTKEDENWWGNSMKATKRECCR